MVARANAARTEAQERAAVADLVLWVVDMSANDGAVIERPKKLEGTIVWLLKNKIDATGTIPHDVVVEHKSEFEFSFPISADTGEGVDATVEALKHFAAQQFAESESVLITEMLSPVSFTV